MTSQTDLNKDMVALLSSLTDGIHQLQEAVKLIHTEINHLKSHYILSVNIPITWEQIKSKCLLLSRLKKSPDSFLGYLSQSLNNHF